MNTPSFRLKNLILFAFVFIFQITSAANNSFFEQHSEIQDRLYKVSAARLQRFLGTSFEAPPLIEADALKQAMESDPELSVINVLPQVLHDDCHIKGSINVPLKELVDTAQTWQKDKKIIVYCALAECDAGEKAYILLSCLGFTDVTDYEGGIKEWFQLGYSTVGPAVSDFLHTKSSHISECDLYPELLVCSRQKRWASRYKDQS